MIEWPKSWMPEWQTLPMPSPRTQTTGGASYIVLDDHILRDLTALAFKKVNHLYRPSHLSSLRAILDDREASNNDRFVAHSLLKNAVVAAGGILPMCQDTGTGTIVAQRGHRVLSSGKDRAMLEAGISDAYANNFFRCSQVSALSTYDEVNTGSNLPAQIEIEFCKGSDYKLLFIAKGGGSANKALLFQSTPSILTPQKLLPFLIDKIRKIGTVACPPYHLSVVVGGTSSEQNQKTLKLAACRHFDSLSTHGNETGSPYRDADLEREILAATQEFDLGAQFGGKYFCLDVRVIRLSRHAGSLPIGIGVSCSADRQAYGLINAEGVYLERLEDDPAKYLPESDLQLCAANSVSLDLTQPIAENLEILSNVNPGQPVRLSGKLLVARDAAHKRFIEHLDREGRLPAYLNERILYYAGPAKSPGQGKVGSFGPTTSSRMDSYVPILQANGQSLIMIGKGNRSDQVRQSCQTYGGAYLGTIGGIAANLSHNHFVSCRVIDHEDLGMEAVWEVEVKDMPAFLIMDSEGRDFFKSRT